MRSRHRPVLLLPLLLLLSSFCHVSFSLGVNWGRTSSHPLPAAKAVTGLLRPNNITRVKLLDADPAVLESLSGSGIGVTVGIPNEMLKALSGSRKAAASWVHDNVTRYFPSLHIEYIAVGDEPFLLSYGQQYEPFVIGAIKNIQLSIASAQLSNQIKIIVPCSSDIYSFNSTRNNSDIYSFKSTRNNKTSTKNTLPLPSTAYFRTDLNKTMTELLTFLAKHNSPFVIDINPFLTLQQERNISMDYLLFASKSKPLIDGRRKYKNFFDSSIDTLHASLSKAGFGNMEIVVGRIGWPTDGAINATSSIAHTFMQGLVEHLNTNEQTKKKNPLETYIFSLLDEDQRSITTGGFERHWGIFTSDGQAKYNVNFGQGTKELVNAKNVEYLDTKWCVLNNNLDTSNVSDTYKDACANADCTALSPGGTCYGVGWPGNVSYAYNSYYQENDQRGDSCDFGGMGLITTVDPSVGECRFAVAIRTSFSSRSAVVSLFLMSLVLGACGLLWFV